MALKSNYFLANTSSNRAISIGQMRRDMDFSNTNARSLSSYYAGFAGTNNVPTGTKGMRGDVPSSGQIRFSDLYEVQKFNYINQYSGAAQVTSVIPGDTNYDLFSTTGVKVYVAKRTETTGSSLLFYRISDNPATAGQGITMTTTALDLTPIKVIQPYNNSTYYAFCNTNSTSNSNKIAIVNTTTATFGRNDLQTFELSAPGLTFVNVTAVDVGFFTASGGPEVFVITGFASVASGTTYGFVAFIKHEYSGGVNLKLLEGKVIFHDGARLLSASGRVGSLSFSGGRIDVQGTYNYSGESCLYAKSFLYNYSTGIATTSWENIYSRGNTDSLPSNLSFKGTLNNATGGGQNLIVTNTFQSNVYSIMFGSYIYEGATLQATNINVDNGNIIWSKYYGSLPTSASLSLPSAVLSISPTPTGNNGDAEDSDFFISYSFRSTSGAAITYLRLTNEQGHYRTSSSVFQPSFSIAVFSNGLAITRKFDVGTSTDFTSPFIANVSSEMRLSTIRLPTDLGANYGNNTITVSGSTFRYNTFSYKTSTADLGTNISLTKIPITDTTFTGTVTVADVANTVFGLFPSVVTQNKFNNY